LRHPFIRKAKKTTYLTELIERHTRWSATNKNEDDNWDSYDGVAPPEQEKVNDDMWDFGTVRLVGDKGGFVNRPGLNAMDESATNARASRSVENSDDYGERRREGSPTKTRDFALQPSDTLKAAGNSGTSRQSSPQRRPIPGSPTKVPLPASPQKTQRSDRLETPKPQKQLPLAPSPQSPDYDRELQAQLQRDMGMLNLNLASSLQTSAPDTADRPVPPPHQPQSRSSSSKFAPINLPEIPPFRGTPSAQYQGVPSQQATQPSQAPTPLVAQRPLPTPAAAKAPIPSPPDVSAAPTSFPSPAPSNPNGDLDALNDVLFPALEEALKRRQVRVQQVCKPGQALTPQQQRAEAAHERIRKLVFKLAHVCKEIDHYDKAEPVGMGRDVGNFLEGLLEEILVRVEPLDEEEAS
jgi:serine/threonine-protein kinase 24/25/MST4